MNNEIADRIFKRIVMQNIRYNLDSIPHSDSFRNEVISLYGISKAELDIIISILKESHKILVMEVAKEDPRKNLERITGYVDADILTIQKLKDVYYKALAEEYEKEYKNKRTPGQIIKELIPRLMYINHTPLGKILNKTIMLDEFERHVEKNYREFTEEWKEENFAIQMSINSNILRNISDGKKESKNDAAVLKDKKPAAPASKRAVDSQLHQEYLNQAGTDSIAKMLQIYGVDFFYRVNLRKYNFKVIEQAIDSGVITRRPDLILLKEMLKKVKENFGVDIELDSHYEEIMVLDRKASRFIGFIKK